jgi:hypothetical protein
MIMNMIKQIMVFEGEKGDVVKKWFFLRICNK